MADKKNLLLLYQRPLEPSFVPKGDKKAVFDIPENYLVNFFFYLKLNTCN